MLLSAPLLSGYVAWKLQQRACRKAVKTMLIEGISDHELVLLVFHRDEAEHKLRFEEEHEFEYEGQMYDIVKSRQLNDSLYFWCWPDAKETALNKHFEEQWQMAWGSSAQRRKTETTLQSWIGLRYVLPESLQLQPALLLQTKAHTKGCFLFLADCLFPPSSPPPEYS